MNDLVVKSNSLINAKGKYKYSTNELKLVCNLISQVDKNDVELDIKTIQLQDLGFTAKDFTNHSYLNELCNELLTKPFKIPNTKKWVNWFTMLEPTNGVINYSFSEHLKPFLLELKEQFTSYYLSNVLKLKSSYSINIYELLKQMEKIGFRRFEMKEFRELLGIPKGYKFSDIKNLLIRVSKDLEKNTDIKFSYRLEKTGRSFTHINFRILKNSDDKNFKSFIKDVRLNYKNHPILKAKFYNEIETISVSSVGKLYLISNPEMKFNSKESLKIWNILYKNKDNLLPFTSSLF